MLAQGLKVYHQNLVSLSASLGSTLLSVGFLLSQVSPLLRLCHTYLLLPPATLGKKEKSLLPTFPTEVLDSFIGSKWLGFGQIPILQPQRRHGWRKGDCLRKTSVLFPGRQNQQMSYVTVVHVVDSHVDKGINFCEAPEMRNRPLAWTSQESRFQLTPKKDLFTTGRTIRSWNGLPRGVPSTRSFHLFRHKPDRQLSTVLCKEFLH